MMNGGIRSNVIPSDGTATLNVRVLPGEDVRAVLAGISHVGAEQQVSFALDRPPAHTPPVSPMTTDLYRALESAAQAMAPNAVAIPFMSSGATDAAVLRAKGIDTYGILPLPLIEEDELRMHGDNERVPLPALGWAAEYIYRVLMRIAAGR